MEEIDRVANVLSATIGQKILRLSKSEKGHITEIRLRRERPVMLTTPGGMLYLHQNGEVSYFPGNAPEICTGAQIEETFHRICGYSVHAYANQLTRGFITLQGGHRAGIAATAVRQGDAVTGVRDISGINLRVARQNLQAAQVVYDALFQHSCTGVLIVGAPGSGKTTVLRDLARRVSDGVNGTPYRVTVLDSRGELAGMHAGVPGLDVGVNTDVLSDYPKAKAIEVAVRTLSPQMIVLDEIGSTDEVQAVQQGLHSGVCFAASVHADSPQGLLARSGMVPLLHSGAFSHVVLLAGADKPCQVAAILEVGELCSEKCRSAAFDGGAGALCGSAS